ncbi:hypothetical protein OIU78_015047 [Salix suchowensis]|nr:hypothetical protein OIU78_015047 [Salix suchowensis]
MMQSSQLLQKSLSPEMSLLEILVIAFVHDLVIQDKFKCYFY